jgi:peptidoglycan/LPS O-acetylase OafA/YrhL
MFTLDRDKNDTSLALDLLRAVAAQMVCVGHALNLSGIYYTYAPAIGVLLFFILSGFVIAYTLKSKTDAGDYSLGRYAIERFSRIYCAYLPAMVLFAAVEYFLRWRGIGPDSSGPVSFSNFLGNLAMLQNYPGPYGFPQFGMSGQTSSIAAEFHIYFFVGALYFFFIGRQRTIALIVGLLSARMPLGYFLSLEGRALFALWLIGFVIYFFVHSIRPDKTTAAGLCMLTVGISFICRGFWQYPDVYNIANFSLLALSFSTLVVLTQNSYLLQRAGTMIHFVAGYSLTLFLVHFVLIRALYLLWPGHPWLTFLIGIIGANIFAAALARYTEARYKNVAKRLSAICTRPGRLAHSNG